MKAEIKRLKDCSIEEIELYLEDKGYAVIKAAELESLEYICENHPG